jgi:[ribosomal protein S5]-alanine N-acetyltransferase
MSRGWPVTLVDGVVGLRPLRRRDASAWRELRTRNNAWLRPWEATAPRGSDEPVPTFGGMVARLRAEARAGRVLPFAITCSGRLAGQLTVGGIGRGSLQSAQVGYWVDQAVAGRGITPTALALAIDHCLGPVGLHRVEVNIRPENLASLRVVEKLALREEGMRLRYLHIDGAWRDHRTFAITREELPPGGLLARWRATRTREP